MDTTKAQRPSWKIDLKWVCGILAFIALWLALFLNTLAIVTERSVATSVGTQAIDSIIASQGLGDNIDLTNLRSQLAYLPAESVAPIAQMPWLKISKADLMTKTPKEIRAQFSGQIANSIYDKGFETATKDLTQNKQQKDNLQQMVFFLSGFNQKSHNAFLTSSRVAWVVAAFLIVGLILLSAEWGRLVSPGVVFLLVSPVGLGTSSFLTTIQPTSQGAASALPVGVLHEVGATVSSVYLTFFLLGIGLLGAALVGKVVTKLIARRNRSADESAKA